MKATKLIKNAVKDALQLTENEYKVKKMAHVFGDKGTTYDVAVILADACYVIRAWKNGGMKYRKVNINELMLDTFIKFISLDE